MDRWDIYAKLNCYLFFPIYYLVDTIIASRSSKKVSFPPVFVIGAPRTGSTIFYQLLTSNYQVGYISNLVHLFYKFPFLGFKVQRWVYGNRPHAIFQSNEGNTYMYGKNGPSECTLFWKEKWPSRHYLAAKDLSVDQKNFYKKRITALSKQLGMPIIFKNLSIGQRLGVIREIFPDAKLIWVKREQADTINSILRARKKYNVATNQLWSLKPKEYIELEKIGDEKEMVSEQVKRLEGQIETDLKQFDSSQIQVINYAELMEEKERLLLEISLHLSVDLRK